MAFSPVLSVCVKSCDKIIFSDITDIYSINNDNGWNNTFSAGDVVAAVINIYDNTGTLLESINVLPTIQSNNPIQGTFEFPEADWTYDDGIYEAELVYTNDALTTFTTKLKFLALPKSKCCLQKAWVNFLDECNSCQEEYIDELIMLDNLLYGVEASVSCIKESVVDKVIKKITKFCNYNKCNC